VETIRTKDEKKVSFDDQIVTDKMERTYADVVKDMSKYCDDNSRFISHKNEKESINAIQQFIQQSGDLSIFIKIGQKGSKCDINLFNLSKTTIANLPDFSTIVWSNVKDAPIQESIPLK